MPLPLARNRKDADRLDTTIPWQEHFALAHGLDPHLEARGELGERPHAGQHAEREREAADEIERLRQMVKELQRLRFGRRSERLDPGQLALALEDVEQSVAALDAADERTPEPRRLRPPRPVISTRP